MKKYYLLLAFLIIFGLFVVGLLVYRAYQADISFAELSL
jgi:hypothetical protein